MKLLVSLFLSTSIVSMAQSLEVKTSNYTTDSCGVVLTESEVIDECEQSEEVQRIHECIEDEGGEVVETVCDSVTTTSASKSKLGSTCKKELVKKSYNSVIKVRYLLN